MKGNLWHVIVVALFLAILLPAVNLGYQATAQTAPSTTTTVTVDYSQPSTIDAGDDRLLSYLDNETITVTDTNTTLTDGTDYQWNTSTGQLTWLNSTATSDGDTATLQYAYRYRGETTTDIAGFLQPWGRIIGVFLLVTALGYFVSMAYGGGGW